MLQEPTWRLSSTSSASNFFSRASAWAAAAVANDIKLSAFRYIPRGGLRLFLSLACVSTLRGDIRPPRITLLLGSTFWKQTLLLYYIIISGLHHHECSAPLATSNLQSGRYWAILTASFNGRLLDSRSFCLSRTVFIHVIRGRPGSLPIFWQ